jgi:hypothetical protein
MSLLTVLILLVLLYVVPELFRSKNQKYEYPDIPDDNPVPTMDRYNYEGEGISLERRYYDSGEGICAMRVQKPNPPPKTAMPSEVRVPEYTEAENPWVGRLDLPHVVNGVIFAEILQPPRAKRPLACWRKRT